MNNLIAPIDGYTLACRVLDHPGGGVAQLIELARGGETDWLELKASMVGRSQDRRPGEKDADGYWHVAKAVISMANTRGGAVIIGVEDQTLNAVGLQAGDSRRVIEKEGMEAYRRKEILERIDPANGEWASGRHGKWRLEAGRLPKELVEIRGRKYQNRDVAVILVKPVENPCIRVWENQVEQILYRAIGNLGKVESIVGSKAMQDFESTRQTKGEDLHHLWERFCGKRMVRIFVSSPEDVAVEREKAKEVIARLQKNFAGKLSLSPVFWEDLPLSATASFQEGIDCLVNDRHGIDIAIFIVWSRLGSSPGSRLKRADGTPYRSGIEREFDLMLEARERSGGKRPDILFYRRMDEEGFTRIKEERKDPEELNELVEQKYLLDDFLRTEFKDQNTGENIRAYLTFDSPITFSSELYRHLKNKLTDYLEEQFSSIEWDGNPYQGLEPFTEDKHPVYFGREENIGEFLNLLVQRRTDERPSALVIGASGSGKSSFVQAGILPFLRSDDSPAALAMDWRICQFSPSQCGKDPEAFLIRQLMTKALLPSLSESLTEEESIAEVRKDFASYLRLCIKPAVKKESLKCQKPVAVLLVVDQLEEVLTVCSGETRMRLLDMLEKISHSLDFVIIATLRNDFYPELQRERKLWNLFQPDGIYPLSPPDITDLQRIITLPAKLAGYRFERENEKSLDQEILAEIRNSFDALPLLEYLLTELTNQAGVEKVLRFADYRKIGGLGGAIGNRAEAIFMEHGGESIESEIFQALVQLDPSNEGMPVRRKVPESDLLNSPAKKKLVSALIEARLLVSDEKTISVTHEALFTHWQRFQKWLEKNRQALAERRNVEHGFAVWEKNNRRKDYLIQGRKPVADAENLLLAHRHFLSGELCDYITKSVKFAQRGERIWKLAAGFMFLAMLGLFGTSLYAFYSFQEATAAAERAELSSIEAEKERQRAEEQQQRAVELVKEREEELARINRYLNPIFYHAMVYSGDMELRALAMELYEETNQFWIPRYEDGNVDEMFTAASTAQLQANQIILRHTDWIFNNTPLDETGREELLRALDFVNYMEVVYDSMLASKAFSEMENEDIDNANHIRVLTKETFLTKGVVAIHLRSPSDAINYLNTFVQIMEDWDPTDVTLKAAKSFNLFETYSSLSHAQRIVGDTATARESAQKALGAGLGMLSFNREQSGVVFLRYLGFKHLGMLTEFDHEPFLELEEHLSRSQRMMFNEVYSIFNEMPTTAFRIENVAPDSPAEGQGLREGDIVLSWSDWAFFNERFPLGDLGLFAEMDRSQDSPREVVVYRDGQTLAKLLPAGLIGATVGKTDSFDADVLREALGNHQAKK